MMGSINGKKIYIPSKADIDRECKKIQATWSEEDFIKRAGRGEEYSHWTPSKIHFPFLRDLINYEYFRNNDLK